MTAHHPLRTYVRSLVPALIAPLALLLCLAAEGWSLVPQMQPQASAETLSHEKQGTPQPSAHGEVATTPVRNIILLIGDGMGFNHLLAGSYYRSGEVHAPPYRDFDLKLAMSTFLQGGAYQSDAVWDDFEQVKNGATDSAAAATAMACGVKTYRYGLGVNCQRQRVENIVEFAEEQGKSTGIVTSVPLSHATPAGFVAHNVSRRNYEEIAREMLQDSRVDVLMGAGHPWYDNNGQLRKQGYNYQYVGGEQLWHQLQEGAVGNDADGDGVADPWTLIESREAFQTLATGSTPKRVLGVPRVASTLQQKRKDCGKNPHADTPKQEPPQPYAAPLIDSVPTLTEMSHAALNVLDNNPQGFFLMIEGGAIDWASHANQSERLIEEQVAFDHTVAAVCNWVEQHSNWDETLVLVTADHECGYLTGPGSNPEWNLPANQGAGQLPGLEWHHDGHTNSLVPLLAKGGGAELLHGYIVNSDPVRGAYVDNTSLLPLMKKIFSGGK